MLPHSLATKSSRSPLRKKWDTYGDTNADRKEDGGTCTSHGSRRVTSSQNMRIASFLPRSYVRSTMRCIALETQTTSTPPGLSMHRAFAKNAKLDAFAPELYIDMIMSKSATGRSTCRTCMLDTTSGRDMRS